MPTSEFRIAVTGDTGFDIYTEYVKGFVSTDERLRRPEAAYDVEIPSGAEFTAKAFSYLLANTNLKIEHLQPKAIKERQFLSTLQKFLIELSRFRPYSTGKERHLSSGSDRERVLRVKRTRPVQDKDELASEDVFHHLIDATGNNPDGAKINLLVIHDGAGSWRRYPPTKTGATNKGDAMALVETVLETKPNPGGDTPATSSTETNWPRVIVNLNQDLPEVVNGNQSGTLQFPSHLRFWNTLAQHADKVCVVCSANTLRQEGASISRRLSWEQTVEDLAIDLLLFDKLRILSQFRHLVIRFGISGAVHVMTDGRNRTADLVFAPLARTGIYRDPTEDGTVEDENIFISAALSKMISEGDRSANRRTLFVDALKSGLYSCMAACDRGYKVWWDTEPKRPTDAIDRFIKELFDERTVSAIRDGYREQNVKPGDPKTLGHAVVPSEILDRPPGTWLSRRSNWEILRNAINPPAGHHPDADSSDSDVANTSRINVGAAIVIFGQQTVLNREWDEDKDEGTLDIISVLERPAYCTSQEETRDYTTLPAGNKPAIPSGWIWGLRATPACPTRKPFYVPVMTFGKLTLIERHEIEGLRSIRNLLKNYLEGSGRAGPSFPPMSIAVFGPPGSGKSFAVKQIAQEINSTLHEPNRGLEPIEYNVAQFRSVDELGDAITRASVVNNEGKIPLIFFDEFDCKWEGSPLGWLKYFLSPMHDGSFHAVRQTIKIARAIFVFAGGVYHSFEQFDPSSVPSSQSRTQESDEETKRQRLFRDQKGPDFISRLRGHINILPVNVGDGEIKPIIRRALILRGLLEERDLLVKVRNQRIAYIDGDLLYALLTIDHYRHGARSMEAILQMCSPMDGKIEKASLPSRAQLSMHVDADEFFIRMYRGRFRLQSTKKGHSNMTQPSNPDLVTLPNQSPSVPVQAEQLGEKGPEADSAGVRAENALNSRKKKKGHTPT